MKETLTLAKSFPHTSHEAKEADNGVPGPDAYQQNPIHSIPGFVIMQDTSKVKKEDDKNKRPVGPESYFLEGNYNKPHQEKSAYYGDV